MKNTQYKPDCADLVPDSYDENGNRTVNSWELTFEADQDNEDSTDADNL